MYILNLQKTIFMFTVLYYYNDVESQKDGDLLNVTTTKASFCVTSSNQIEKK